MAAVNGTHFDELVADLARAVDELTARLERDPALWNRGRPVKWTAGQHAEHLAEALELMIALFEDSAIRMAAGELSDAPVRGPLQALFFAVIVRPGWMPRGGAAIEKTLPSDAPVRDEVLRRLRQAPGRYQALGEGLEATERDRLWIRNPFMTRMHWHYSLPEAVRIQAVHVRHHAAQIDELARP